MKRIAVEGDFSGQMASGNIFNNGFCPGFEACPYERREADRERQFEKTTGIFCSAGAREALEHLLDSGVFDYKQLALSWRTRSIYWDPDAHELKTFVSRIELYYGLFLVGFGILAFLLLGISLILGHREFLIDGNPPRAAYLIYLIVFSSIAPVSAKYLVKPNQIAKRATSYLDDFYTRQEKKDEGMKLLVTNES